MGGRKQKALAAAVVVAAVLLGLGGGFVSEEFAWFPLMLGVVPTPLILRLVTIVLWAVTVKIYPALSSIGLLEFKDCFDEDVSSTIKVLIAAPKGGALYSSFVARDFAKNCGVSLGLSYPVEDNWKDPPPDVLPEHEVDFLMAFGLSVNHWHEYLDQPFNANKKLQCVVMTRNPFERFLSLYKYTRDAGETGLILYSKEMKKMKDVEARVKYAWTAFGETMMERTHSLLTAALKRNCTQIKADELFFKSSEKYDENVGFILKAFGVKEEAAPALMKVLQKLDMNRMSSEEKAANNHISGKSLEVGEKELAKKIIRKDPQIASLLSRQCRELNLDC